MKFEPEIEKILKEKGIAPPSMSGEEFGKRLRERLQVLIPKTLAEVVDRASEEIIFEELKRLGRDAACKFFQHRKCAKGLDASQCLECLSYKPKREWGKWLLQRVAPEKLEWVVIGFGTLVLVLALISPELRLWVVIFWFIMFVVSRLHIIYLWKLVRVLNRGLLRWLK